MPSLVIKTYEQILQQEINDVVSMTALVDVTDTSSFKHMLAAPARQMDEIYFQMGIVLTMFSLDTATGEDLDARGAEVQPVGQTRIQAQKSTGTVVFGRSGTAGAVNIPVGTTVKTPSGISFKTTALGTIPDLSSVSGSVPAIAVIAGASGNVAGGTVSRFESRPAGVNTVTNDTDFTAGFDQEGDDAFRRRIKNYIKSLPRSMVSGLEFIATSQALPTGQRVVFSKAVEDPFNLGEVTLYIDDGSGTAESSTVVTGEILTTGFGGPPSGNGALGGEVFLFTNFKPVREGSYSFTKNAGALVEGVDYLFDPTSGKVKMTVALVNGDVIASPSYTAETGLVAQVQKAIDGDPADRDNFPGWRAAGVRVHVKVPSILQQLVTGTVLILEGFDRTTVLTSCKQAVLTYINNLGVSGDVVLAELIRYIMEVPGVANLSLTSPTEDVIVLDDQLPRISLVNADLE
jgi:uncharacterized phage protein gp47/JayE